MDASNKSWHVALLVSAAPLSISEAHLPHICCKSRQVFTSAYLPNNLTLRKNNNFPRQLRTRFPTDEFHPGGVTKEKGRASDQGR